MKQTPQVKAILEEIEKMIRYNNKNKNSCGTSPVRWEGRMEALKYMRKWIKLNKKLGNYILV